MIRKLTAAAALAATVALPGCIIVDEEPETILSNDIDSVQANSVAARDTCGTGNVDEVTADGFTCKSQE